MAYLLGLNKGNSVRFRSSPAAVILVEKSKEPECLILRIKFYSTVLRKDNAENI